MQLVFYIVQATLFFVIIIYVAYYFFSKFSSWFEELSERLTSIFSTLQIYQDRDAQTVNLLVETTVNLTNITKQLADTVENLENALEKMQRESAKKSKRNSRVKKKVAAAK